MVSRSFSFGGTWVIEAPPAAVHDVLTDLGHYPEWWPQVVAVAALGPDDARVLCRSRLPYTLDLVLHAISREPGLLEVGVSGDLDGMVRWRLCETTAGTRMDFEQEVEVNRLIGAAAYVARPLLTWNHDRMMAGCIEGLRRRLAGAC